MKLIVTPHVIQLVREETVNEKEINISDCEFVFDEAITEDFTKEAYFTRNGVTYKKMIIEDRCDYPNEILKEKGTVELGVVAFKIDYDDVTGVRETRYNPEPMRFTTINGSLKEDVENSEPITPSELEQYEQALDQGLKQAQRVDIDAEKRAHVSTITVTRRTGEQKSVEIYDGVDGKDGIDGRDGIDGSGLYATWENEILHLHTIENAEERDY